MASKSTHIILSYTVSKLVHFLRHSVLQHTENPTTLKNNKCLKVQLCWMVFTTCLGQGLGELQRFSMGLIMDPAAHLISVSSRTKCPTSWSRLSRMNASRVASQSRPERSHAQRTSPDNLPDKQSAYLPKAIAKVLPRDNSEHSINSVHDQSLCEHLFQSVVHRYEQYTVWVKKIPTKVFWHFFTNTWEFFVQILHTYYTFLSTLDYKFLFN